MKRIAKVVLGVIGALLLLAVLLLTAPRFADGPLGGPLEIVAAGPFESGTPYVGPEPDWSFLTERATVQFQLLEPPRSRTAWILVHDGRPFIVSGYMDSWYGKIWKQWPAQADADGRAILRVDETLYVRQMVRIMRGPDVAPVLAELGRKYVGGAAIPEVAVTSGSIWMFELRPRG